MQLYKQLHSSQLQKSADVILFQVSCKSMSFHITFKGHVSPLAPNVFDHFSPRGPQAVLFFLFGRNGPLTSALPGIVHGPQCLLLKCSCSFPESFIIVIKVFPCWRFYLGQVLFLCVSYMSVYNSQGALRYESFHQLRVTAFIN